MLLTINEVFDFFLKKVQKNRSMNQQTNVIDLIKVIEKEIE